ncbi:MAG: hypothetical protein WA895_36790, partial [Streptosporangiaceae bacterium]
PGAVLKRGNQVLTSAFSEPSRLWLRLGRRLPRSAAGRCLPGSPLGLDPKEELGLAPAEAKNSTANQQAVIVVAFSEPVWNR